jgi:hypothetical protein
LKPRGELVGHLLGGALGAGEDHRRAAALGLQDAADHLDLVQGVRAVDELLGGVVGGRALDTLGPDVVGWFMKVRASVMIGSGMVAENSIACRSSGICRRMRSMSGRKPRSSISSASSRTSTESPPSCRWPCWPGRAGGPAFRRRRRPRSDSICGS